MYQIPEKPLHASMDGGKVEPPQKVYFYERPDGSIVHTDAKEAWGFHKKFKQIGVSDGVKYHQAVLESRDLFRQQGLAAAQDRLRQGFAEELEAARGKLERPPNADKMGNGAHLI